MRLYVTPMAPNVVRVQVIALEMCFALETVDVSATLKGEYLRLNPLGQVPALELDDGELITESRTIAEYVDAVSGAPYLFGSTPEERARIGMWERRAEMLLFNPSVEYGHHTHPMFAQWIQQHPEWVTTLVPQAMQMVGIIADRLEHSLFLAGDEVSAADFTAALGYFAMVAWGAIPSSDRSSVQAWSTAMLARPSMEPVRQAAQLLQKASEPQGVEV